MGRRKLAKGILPGMALAVLVALGSTSAPASVGAICQHSPECEGPHLWCVAADATSTTGHCEFIRVLP